MSPSSRDAPRLVRRVALAGAVWAAVAGACAAMFGGVLTGRLVERHEDREVLTAARELADEIREELERGAPNDIDDEHPIVIGPDGRPVLASVLDHELADVKQPNAVGSIVEAGAVIAGDRELPIVAAGACELIELHGLPRRVCAQQLDEGRVVALGVSAQDERERRTLILWGLVVGALLGGAIGGFASHRSASWTIAPLTELGTRVRRIDAEAPSAQLLDPPARHAEIEELRAAIAQLVERLGASLTHAQSFAAQAAHELRTPLAVLGGELDLLIEAARDPAEVEVLRRLHARVDELVRLVQRLLVLARPGRAPAEQGEAVELADVVQLVHEGLAPELRARVQVESTDDTVVRGDPELLRALVQNAVDNALKFSKGPVQLRLAAAEHVTIDVLDSGPGIPAHERAQVFAPFYRRSDANTRRAPGHGVGLALVAHVAAAHGGHAELRDRDVGAHLHIELPRWSS